MVPLSMVRPLQDGIGSFVVAGANWRTDPAQRTIDNVAIWVFRLLIGAMTALLGVWLVVRWFCCWRNLKRFVLAGACLASLIVLFYVEEDWRGWHAWKKFRNEWESKGEQFSVAKLVPPPVPDEQPALTPRAPEPEGELLAGIVRRERRGRILMRSANVLIPRIVR